MNLDQLDKLYVLKEKGAISEAEYEHAKAQLLSDKPAAAGDNFMASVNSRDYSMFMHFSQLLWFFVPILSWVVTLVMWVLKKDDEYVDQQGRIIFNWFISLMIYSVVTVILCFVLIGFLLFPLLIICAVIFSVLGAVRARDGVIRNYPLTLPILALNPDIGKAPLSLKENDVIHL